MASSTKIATSLKLVYNLGMDGDKVISKSKTIAGINIDATDDHVYGFAEALLKLQDKPASISRVDSEILNA